MCGRYWLEPESDEELLRIVEQLNRAGEEREVKLAGEIFPGDRVPVLCLSRAGNVRPFAMTWGYALPGGRLVFNARMETAAEKPLFRDGMRARRCLLPMCAYFEWEKRDGSKIRHRIAPREGGLHCLAGLYRFEGDRPACTVLTVDAAPELAFIHDRMPVIIPPAAREAWLREAEVAAVGCFAEAVDG